MRNKTLSLMTAKSFLDSRKWPSQSSVLICTLPFPLDVCKSILINKFLALKFMQHTVRWLINITTITSGGLSRSCDIFRQTAMLYACRSNLKTQVISPLWPSVHTNPRRKRSSKTISVYIRRNWVRLGTSNIKKTKLFVNDDTIFR